MKVLIYVQRDIIIKSFKNLFNEYLQRELIEKTFGCTRYIYNIFLQNEIKKLSDDIRSGSVEKLKVLVKKKKCYHEVTLIFGIR